MKKFWEKKPHQIEDRRPPRPPQKPRKKKCKIKFKKTENGEDIEISPDCTQVQIDLAKRIREEHNQK